MMLALMREQAKNGHKVSAVVHHHDSSQRFLQERFEAITLYRLPILLTLLFVPISLQAFFRLCDIIKTEAPDVLHLHMPNATCFWLLFSGSARKLPWVIHWHSDVIGAKPDWRIKLLYPFYRILEKALLNRASKVIVTSTNYLQSSQPLNEYRNKCEVVPLGLPDLEFNDSQRSEDKRSDRFSLLCIGRLTYYKGHEFLIRAMSSLREAVTLTIVGEGEKLERLRNVVEELELSSRVTFILGATNEQVINNIVQCDALVLPSIERTEAFGLVLLEAMRAGKPCICTDVKGSGMSEVVQHERTGLVVESSSSEALSKAIDDLSFDDSLCATLGNAGRERFKTVFQIDAIARRVDDLYSEL